MKIKTFIDRPILSCIISAFILMVGIIGLTQLPIEQFPNIAPPTVNVTATYTGANAETILKSVITPLEESINGVENMTYMTSSATNTGTGTITIYFKQGSDANTAQVNVQNRVAAAQGLLPAEVTKVGVTTTKRLNSTLKVISLYSEDGKYDDNFLNNYLKINILPKISRISGVGDVFMMGSEYSMRIWLKPEAMAQYGLVPSDITSVLGEQNIESPTGTLGENSKNTFQYTLKYRGRYETTEEFGNMVIRSLSNGQILHLKDVATIQLGALSYGFKGEVAGKPGTTAVIYQQAGSNANEIIKNIDASLTEISEQLPHGVKIVDLISTKDFLDASIDNVIHTLLEAIILVIIVVYVFLQSLRSTFIPTVSIIVSLVGTFAFMYIAGFSLNLLTLFALVLVIGTVVDDAIIVVEAVQTKFDEGYKSSYEATVKAMDTISSALITTSLVFMSVFIPVCFMGGTTGTFYTQFGLTMAVAVGISLVNALTLSPALCALFMTPHLETGKGKQSLSTRFHNAFEASYNGLILKYKNAARKFIKKKKLAFGLIILAVSGLFVLLNTTKTSLVPEEDTGAIYVNVATSPGSTLAETDRVMTEIDKRIKTLPQIENYAKITGYGMLSGQGATSGIFFIRMKPWDDRTKKEDHIKSVINRIYAQTADIKAAKIMVFAQPLISGYGTSNGVEMSIQDRKGSTVEELQQHTQAFIKALSECPEISMAYTSFETKYPQYKVEVDAALCKKHNISPSEVLSTLSGYVGGSYSSNLNLFSKLYRVMVQAAPEYRLDKESLNNIFVRTSTGEMSPIGQYLKLTKVYGPESLSRFNMFSSISLTIMPATGYSSGQAIEAINRVAAESLPNGYGFEFSGMSREQASAGSSTIIIFIICILLVYMIMCALFESLFIPLAVMLSVPFGLMGSFLFANFFGIENNIYMQTGLIMLIGLLSKTAILLTEYASQRRREGATIVQAALDSATVRLRPIMMTALAMIFGMLPMAFTSGAGANGSRTLAIGTIGGILIGTIALLFIVPFLFVIFQHIQERIMPTRHSSDNNQ
ncbi:efflux RND transporter permease subunit [uncultured Bacteroides sp.]|uniref:efflux RND transporter permease subunit n=1 Tax=uncultured Bacteroides sp. TaxID=162156 RepID=UPI002AA77C2B|nr:efflux RND transporter permease subunit [uncultured Bacteroides sp.]